MAKLSIRLPEEYKRTDDNGRPGYTASRFYQVLVDGREIAGITSVDVSWDIEGVPSARITFSVDDLEVDANVLTILEAHVQSRKG